jgi:hypothetical protein
MIPGPSIIELFDNFIPLCVAHALRPGTSGASPRPETAVLREVTPKGFQYL